MMPGIGSACGVLTAAGGYSAVANPSSVSKTQSSFGGSPLTLTTPTTTVTVTGGTASYTHSWARISGSSLISATSASAAATAFTATLDPGVRASAVFGDTVTDANGVVTTATCSVSIVHVDTR